MPAGERQLWTNAKTADRAEFPPETVEALAGEFAAWRLGGCPGYGFSATFGAKVKKAAAKCNRSHSELWALIHARGYELIDAGAR